MQMAIKQKVQKHYLHEKEFLLFGLPIFCVAGYRPRTLYSGIAYNTIVESSIIHTPSGKSVNGTHEESRSSESRNKNGIYIFSFFRTCENITLLAFIYHI